MNNPHVYMVTEPVEEMAASIAAGSTGGMQLPTTTAQCPAMGEQGLHQRCCAGSSLTPHVSSNPRERRLSLLQMALIFQAVKGAIHLGLMRLVKPADITLAKQHGLHPGRLTVRMQFPSCHM